MKKIILLSKSGRGVIAVGETGFTSTGNHNKATQFDTDKEAVEFCKQAGIFMFRVVDFYKTPKLTPFEQFCYENGNRSSFAVATETNRTESAVSAGYARGEKKVKEIAAIKKIYGVA